MNLGSICDQVVIISDNILHNLAMYTSIQSRSQLWRASVIPHLLGPSLPAGLGIWPSPGKCLKIIYEDIIFYAIPAHKNSSV